MNTECPVCNGSLKLSDVKQVALSNLNFVEVLRKIVAESKTGFVPSSSKNRMVSIAQAAINAVGGKENGTE